MKDLSLGDLDWNSKRLEQVSQQTQQHKPTIDGWVFSISIEVGIPTVQNAKAWRQRPPTSQF